MRFFTLSYHHRNAFTMIELIFVIIILGIVSSIGSEIIANVYKNYILQRATHRASLKTELAAQQISNLLAHRIPGTAIMRDPSNLANINGSTYVNDPTNQHDFKHTVLEWIGSADDSFSASNPPPWSGFCDVNASNQSKIITPGSKLNNFTTIMNNLGNSSASKPIIFFRHFLYSKDSSTGTTLHYNALPKLGEPACLGMVSGDKTCISPVDITDDTTLTFNGAGSATKKVIAEHYKLAWTAYAIAPYKSDNSGFCTPGDFTNTGEVHCDLKLLYNYQPWENERLDNSIANIPKATLVRNVTVFKVAESDPILRFKLCAQENIGEDYNISICKEKAVLR